MADRPTGFAQLDPRIRMSSLWVSKMLIVAFIDIIAFYRADVREQIEAGQASVITIGPGFMARDRHLRCDPLLDGRRNHLASQASVSTTVEK